MDVDKHKWWKRLAIFAMDEKVEQRVCLKFCVANGISCADSLKMLQKAFGDALISKTRAYEWYRAFKGGRKVVEDLERSGRPSTSRMDENIDEVGKLLAIDRRMTLREMGEELGISHESVRTILRDVFGMRRVAARLVPKELNFLQKVHRKEVAEEMLQMVNSDPTIMKRIITGDETWVYEYDMLTSQQSSEWRTKNEPKPKKPRQSRSKIKVMLTVFFDYRGVVHWEFLPNGQTVNKEYYLAVMRRLRENVRRKRPDLWKDNSWILHHDNAQCHTSHLVRNFLAKNSTTVLPQAPYSPDMSPPDFFLFSKLKRPLRGTRFHTIETIKQKSQEQLRAITSFEFERCFQDWIKRWHKCIASEGAYFEGDNIELNE